METVEICPEDFERLKELTLVDVEAEYHDDCVTLTFEVDGWRYLYHYDEERVPHQARVAVMKAILEQKYAGYPYCNFDNANMLTHEIICDMNNYCEDYCVSLLHGRGPCPEKCEHFPVYEAGTDNTDNIKCKVCGKLLRKEIRF
jgi:hypothetical protein